MLKKIAAALFAVGLISALTFVPAPVADAGRATCDPQYSVVCQGLVDWWSFEEYTGNVRHGSLQNSALLERRLQRHVLRRPGQVRLQ